MRFFLAGWLLEPRFFAVFGMGLTSYLSILTARPPIAKNGERSLSSLPQALLRSTSLISHFLSLMNNVKGSYLCPLIAQGFTYDNRLKLYRFNRQSFYK
jgi:hypothetical protein